MFSALLFLAFDRVFNLARLALFAIGICLFLGAQLQFVSVSNAVLLSICNTCT